MSGFKTKMHRIRFPLVSAPDPAGGAYSAPTDPLAVFKEPTSKRGRRKRGRRERKREGRGREGKGRKEKRMGGNEGRGRATPNILV